MSTEGRLKNSPKSVQNPVPFCPKMSRILSRLGELLSTQRKSEKNGFFGPFLGPRGSPAGASIWAQKGPENALFFRYCAHPKTISFILLKGPFWALKWTPKKAIFGVFFVILTLWGFGEKTGFLACAEIFRKFGIFPRAGILWSRT